MTRLFNFLPIALLIAAIGVTIYDNSKIKDALLSDSPMTQDDAAKHKGEIKEFTWLKQKSDDAVSREKQNFAVKAEHLCGSHYTELDSRGVSSGTPLEQIDNSKPAYIQSKIRCDG